MKTFKLKTFENYEKTGPSNTKQNVPEISEEELNSKIKDIISNVLKTKQYVEMLYDSVENVLDMVSKQIPPNAEDFIDTLYQKNDMLASLMEDLIGIVDDQEIIINLKDMVETLENIENYTEGNMDDILSGKSKDEGDEGEELDITEEDDDEEDEFCPKCKGTGENKDGGECEECDGTGYAVNGPLIPPSAQIKKEPYKRTSVGFKTIKHPIKEDEDQLKRKKINTGKGDSGPNNAIIGPPGMNEQLKRKGGVTLKDIESKMKKFAPVGKEFNKGDEVYVSGLIGDVARRFNGKKCVVIGKSEDKVNCYDLYDPTSPPSKDGSNIKGMPVKYMSREKPTLTPIPKKPIKKPKK